VAGISEQSVRYFEQSGRYLEQSGRYFEIYGAKLPLFLGNLWSKIAPFVKFMDQSGSSIWHLGSRVAPLF
jgi:hypothetical protein